MGAWGGTINECDRSLGQCDESSAVEKNGALSLSCLLFHLTGAFHCLKAIDSWYSIPRVRAILRKPLRMGETSIRSRAWIERGSNQ
ncbi:unnamed protein product [Calypogeia fissa]